MIHIENIDHFQKIYPYQMCFASPWFFSTDFAVWEKSFTDDVDGEGRRLFKELWVKAAYEDHELIGFVQYGKTAFGFDGQGDISSEVSYCVIRNLYFPENRTDAGEMLLNAALEAFAPEERVYAFFHYFGMSCFARHGKLFEKHSHIEALLKRKGFEIEHENVYYASRLDDVENVDVEILPHNLTAGNQQYLDFLLNGKQVGGCEVHYLDAKTTYLRWIYVNGDLVGNGIGTKCMSALKQWLYQKGTTRLDTDTALTNPVAQHFYEKNGFTREGISRSYYRL